VGIVSQPLPFEPISVVIADEEAVSRSTLRKLLAQPGIEIVGEAGDADSAALVMARLAPQVLLLDYSLCCKLHERADRTGRPKLLRTIVMLTAPDKSHVIDSFRRGAQGVVMKRSERLMWRDSIATVAAGQYWVGDESLAVLIQAVCDSPQPSCLSISAKSYGLTAREIEIIRKIADGCSNKEVGRDFAIQERTVKHHLTNIFDKVGVTSRLELALFARDHKIMLHASSEGVSADVAEEDREEAKPSLGIGASRRIAIRNRLEMKRRIENA
jgi:DNA-binding NarL/FixJ family response regulator